MPIYKSITFDNKTTIAQLIKSALQAYSNDKSLEPSKIKNMAYNSNLYINDRLLIEIVEELRYVRC